jgi:hypothetical protein
MVISFLRPRFFFFSSSFYLSSCFFINPSKTSNFLSCKRDVYYIFSSDVIYVNLGLFTQFLTRLATLCVISDKLQFNKNIFSSKDSRSLIKYVFSMFESLVELLFIPLNVYFECYYLYQPL